jgi:hypothetical protein
MATTTVIGAVAAAERLEDDVFPESKKHLKRFRLFDLIQEKRDQVIASKAPTPQQQQQVIHFMIITQHHLFFVRAGAQRERTRRRKRRKLSKQKDNRRR